MLQRLGRDLVNAQTDPFGDALLVQPGRRIMWWPGFSDHHKLNARSSAQEAGSNVAVMIHTGWLGGPSATAKSAILLMVARDCASAA